MKEVLSLIIPKTKWMKYLLMQKYYNDSCLQHHPIISLASINRINLLQKIFNNIVIPEAVYHELKAKETYGFSEADEDFISIAKDLGLNPIRTLSIFISAKERVVINECKPLLDQMLENGRWYSKQVYNTFLQKVGE